MPPGNGCVTPRVHEAPVSPGVATTRERTRLASGLRVTGFPVLLLLRFLPLLRCYWFHAVAAPAPVILLHK
ncbi:hypothetical protein NDU88_000725 [Pleurodeles waltl]|uniref:Uncharacterized protein n=1 Tax=Pleurodeles waltl TaxID=8319 RepID=A0AAV7LDW2_PLEWA|nr:hypothetical protein NDU88_000725 [Pleurodeles waltl]